MSNIKDIKQPFSLTIGFTFLSFLIWLLVICGIYLLADIHYSKFIVYSSFLLCLISTILITKNIRKTLISGLILIFTLLLASWISSKLYDTAFDSIGYHLRTVIAISNGWNPIYDSSENLPLWSNHYAKGLEILYSAIFTFTGNLESTKCINIVFLIATLSILYYTITIVLPNLSIKSKILILIMVLSNTILVNQILSAMNDFALWLETCLLVCGFILAKNNKSSIIPYFLISISLILGINTKFSHFFFIGIGCIIFAIWCIFNKKFQILKKGCISVFSALIIGIGIIGFNPYITNLTQYGNPIYPLGTDKVDIMTGNTPEMLRGNNRIINLVKSFCSLDDKPWALIKGEFSIKDIVESYTVSKSRVNGFGAAMPLLLLLSLIMMIISKPKLKWWVCYIIIFLLCLIFKEGWWARYMPFLWLNLLLPVILCLCCNKHKISIIRKLLLATYSIIMIGGALISCIIMLGTRIGYTNYLNYIFEQCRKYSYTPLCFEMNDIHKQQFYQENIQYIEINDTNLEETYWFYIYGDGFFDAMIYLPKEKFHKIYEEPNTLIDKLSVYSKRKYKTKNK